MLILELDSLYRLIKLATGVVFQSVGTHGSSLLGY
jgi:hypothetical protein